MDNGGGFLEKKKENSFHRFSRPFSSPPPIRFDREPSPSPSSPRERIRYDFQLVYFNLYVSTEQRSETEVVYPFPDRCVVDWFRFGNDNPPPFPQTRCNFRRFHAASTTIRILIRFFHGGWIIKAAAPDQSSRPDNYPPDCYLPRYDNNRGE